MNKGRSAERKLVSQIAGGDRDACARLIREHYESIYRFLARLCRDAHWAEDLTQETFAACWSKIGNFQGRSTPRTWLRRIAYHKFIDWQRKSNRQIPAAYNTQTTGIVTADDDGVPEKHLEADETRQGIQAAMEKLPPAQYEVIVLHYLEGLSYRELAHLLDEPAGTVKCRTSQALGRLKEILEQQVQ